MYTIDLSIKNTAFPVSIERKSAEEAEDLYQKIVGAMRSGIPEILELNSEGKIEKKVAIRASEISGVQILQKDGVTTSSGRPPGFVALSAE